MYGLTTVIVPAAFSVIDVGPVNRHPAPPRVASAFTLIASVARRHRERIRVLRVAAVGERRVRRLQLPPVLLRYRLSGVPAPCQLVVTLPLNVGLPQIRIASFECSGPLITSPETKLMSVQTFPSVSPGKSARLSTSLPS